MAPSGSTTLIDWCDKHDAFITDAKVGGEGKCPKCAEEEARNPEPPHTTVVAGQDLVNGTSHLTNQV